MMSFGRGVLGFSILTASGFGVYLNLNKEKYGRTLTLWSQLGPVISHYRAIEFKQKMFPVSDQESDQEYLELHQLYADKVKNTLRDLRGFYIKIGQVMAHRSDILHELYIEKLRDLEDKVPHSLNEEQVKNVICESLKIQDLAQVFSEFDPKPLGSASIGQVHAARLVNGEKVAVKVQDPAAEALFRGDIMAARHFCKIFAPEQLIIFDEIEKQFLTEFDYREEAKNLLQVAENMASFRNVVVPRPYTQFCSREVLTMQFLKGPKLVDGIRENGKHYASSIGKSYEELEREYRLKYASEGLPPPYKGPSSLQLEVYRHALKIKDHFLNVPIHLVNGVLGLLYFCTGLNAFKSRLSYFHSFVPLNAAYIMDTLLKTHGHQLLIDGKFNADCHPGNFLLLEGGKIGMIDYGQVKHLTTEERIIMSKLILALARKDKQGVADIMFQLGSKSKYNNAEVMYRMVVVGFDQDGRNVTDGLNLQQFMDKMFALDPWEKTADTLIMPMRLSLLIRGVGLMLNHPVSVATAWKELAEQALKKEGITY